MNKDSTVNSKTRIGSWLSLNKWLGQRGAQVESLEMCFTLVEQ